MVSKYNDSQQVHAGPWWAVQVTSTFTGECNFVSVTQTAECSFFKEDLGGTGESEWIGLFVHGG